MHHNPKDGSTKDVAKNRGTGAVTVTKSGMLRDISRAEQRSLPASRSPFGQSLTVRRGADENDVVIVLCGLGPIKTEEVDECMQSVLLL